MIKHKPQASAVAGFLLAGLIVLLAGTAYAQEDAPTSPPAEGEEAPPAEGEAPPAEGETPPAEGEAPPPEGETPPAEGETPPPEGETPPPEGEVPPPEGETLQPEGEQPPAEGEVPPPEEEAPVEEPAEEPPSEISLGSDTAPDTESEDAAEDSKVDDVGASKPKDHLKLTLNSGHEMTFKISFLYELHVTLDSAEHSANDWSSLYVLRGDWNITKFDQVSLRMDLEQKYIADPGENGLWFGDLRLYYARKFSIPIPNFSIPGKASLYMTAPTSRVDRARSYITKPTATLTLAPGWGPLTLVTQGYFRYAIAKYAEPDENAMYTNTRFTGGYVLQLVYAPLDWFAPYVAWQQAWNQGYPDREMETQRWKPVYSFELAADFAIPLPQEWPTLDLILAYTQGAPMIDSGVYRTYFFQRDASQLYLGINIVY